MLTQFITDGDQPVYTPLSNHLNGDNNNKRLHASANYFIAAQHISEVIQLATENIVDAKRKYFAPTIQTAHYSIYENQPIFALKPDLKKGNKNNGYKEILGSLHGIPYDRILQYADNKSKPYDELTVKDLLSSIQFLGMAMQNLPYSQFFQGGETAPLAVAFCGVLPLKCNACAIKSGQEVVLSLPFLEKDKSSDKNWRYDGWRLNLDSKLVEFDTQLRLDFMFYPVMDSEPFTITTLNDEDGLKARLLMQKFKVGRCVKESKTNGYATVHVSMDRGFSSYDDLFVN